jgi:type II secretory pathway component PulJ
MRLKIVLIAILLSSLLLSQTSSLPTELETQLSKQVAQQQWELMQKNMDLIDRDRRLSLKQDELEFEKKKADYKNDEIFWLRVQNIAAWVAIIVVTMK